MSVDLLASVLADRRLSTETTRARSRFTLARNEALLRLRGAKWSPHGAIAGARPWIWTLGLVRAARVASDAASVRVSVSVEQEVPVITLCFALPGADLVELELSGLLYAALEPDRGRGSVHTRLRRLLGRALNGALGSDPRWVELHTPAGSRRWERSAEHETGGANESIDPYVERLIAGPRPEGHEPAELTVLFAMPRVGWGRALTSLFSRDDPSEDIDALWHRVFLGADPEEHVRAGLSLVVRYPAAVVDLGTHAQWGRASPDAPAPDQGIWLVRDGVLLARLDVPLAAAGLDTTALHGFIDCPALCLTVDEGKVVEDDAFEALVAWLFDALAHTRDDGRVVWAPEGEADSPHPRLQTASGAALSLDVLEDREDVVFVWRHRAAEVPAALQTRVLALWPSQHRWLREHRARLRLVPLHALGRSPGVRPADLTDLVQGSFAPLTVPVPAFVEGDVSWSLDVRAYVHRPAFGEQGVAVVLAYGRRVGFVTDPGHVVAGVSVVIELLTDEATTLRIDALQDDAQLLRRLVAHVVDRVRDRSDDLVAGVLDTVGAEDAWSVPHVRARIGEGTAWSLGLRYVEERGATGPRVRLHWVESPLTRLIVGRTLTGEHCTIGDAWARARDVGGVVTTEPTRRWQTLESEDEAYRPWVLTQEGRDLVERTLGRETMWVMPIVAEGQPRVAPVADQPALRLSTSEVARLRSRVATEPSARMLLLAHALASRADGHAAPEVEELPILRHYDPRAMTPSRHVSLAAVRELASPPGLVPVGAVARSLEEPVLELPPALAALLAEVEGFRPAREPSGRRVSGVTVSVGAASPLRKGGRREEPLVTVGVVDRLAAGALALERQPSGEGIVLWARGLRVGTLRLPSPLRGITGRLWLTDAGIVAGHAGLHALALRHGLVLTRAAVRAHLLTPPGSTRRRAIEAFLNACREAVATDRDRAGIGPLLEQFAPRFGVQTGLDATTLEASDRKTRALPQALGRTLDLVVRHALEQPVMIETALLSRAPVRVAEPAAWPWRLRLGRRHPWIRKGLRDDASPADVRAAACLVVAEAIRQVGGGRDRLVRALVRLLDGAFPSR